VAPLRVVPIHRPRSLPRTRGFRGANVQAGVPRVVRRPPAGNRAPAPRVRGL